MTLHCECQCTDHFFLSATARCSQSCLPLAVSSNTGADSPSGGCFFRKSSFLFHGKTHPRNSERIARAPVDPQVLTWVHVATMTCILLRGQPPAAARQLPSELPRRRSRVIAAAGERNLTCRHGQALLNVRGNIRGLFYSSLFFSVTCRMSVLQLSPCLPFCLSPRQAIDRHMAVDIDDSVTARLSLHLSTGSAFVRRPLAHKRVFWPALFPRPNRSFTALAQVMCSHDKHGLHSLLQLLYTGMLHHETQMYAPALPPGT